MGLTRKLLLAGSQSRWLREQATRRRFVRRAVSRFMPGEELDDALAAAAALRPSRLGAVLTRLGENVASDAEADEVARHYAAVLERIAAGSHHCEISVKPTQLGLDIDHQRCFQRLGLLAAAAARAGIFLWVDMEQSRYVEATLDLVLRARALSANVGVCVQAYLRRTAADVDTLLAAGAGVRLVKGAYLEPAAIAYPAKADVDARFFELARTLLRAAPGTRVVFGTHDARLIAAIRAEAAGQGRPPAACEFHLLFGIQRALQDRLAAEGARVRVLISYGSYWFPWYMRRLAERPANVLFVARSLFAR